MTAAQVRNLLKSGAKVWVAPTGETVPDETTVAADAAWGGNWAQLGWTKAPLAVGYESERTDFHVEQFLAAVKRRKIKESGRFETVLAEATAEHLAYAIGYDATDSNIVDETSAGASQKAYEELVVGGTAVLTEWAVGFEGITYDGDDAAQPVRIFFDRMTFTMNGDLSFSQKDDDYTGIPISGDGLADTANGGRLFTWQRVTAAASS